jgi:hydrogenase-4 component B
VITVLAAAAIGIVGGGAFCAADRRLMKKGLWLQAAGAVCVAAAGLMAFVSASAYGDAFRSQLDPGFGVDRMSGLFLALIGLVAAPVLVFATAYFDSSGRARAVAALNAMFVLALVGVICARDVTTFLALWELMTLIPAVIILIWQTGRAARRAAFVYIAITHLAGTGVWTSLLVLAHEGALGGAPLSGGSRMQALVTVAALVGFGAKAGVMPLHTWLPRAHPIAPAPVSALMSGVMIKVALYGLIRVLVEWTQAPSWVGITVLALGAVSAVGGVVYALFEHELKRLLALHSIENVGIILLGLGAYLTLHAQGQNAWATFGLAAALLHTVNHGVFKALLFLGAGAFDQAIHDLNLDRLGGLAARMPLTGAAFGIGAAAIAGIPPLNGFVSEWLTLQALLHLGFGGDLPSGTAGAVALAALAVTAALAVFCFVKVIGLVLLGPARRHSAATANESPTPMLIGMGALAAACVFLGAAPAPLVERLTALTPGPVGRVEIGQAGLNLPATGHLPTLGIGLLLLGVTLVLLRARGRATAAETPTWACGQPVVRSLDWSSAGFTKALRLAFETILRPERDVVTTTRHGIVQEVSYWGEMPHHLDRMLYEPTVRLALAAAARVRRLQSGQLGMYVAYLAAVLFGLLVCLRLELLG